MDLVNEPDAGIPPAMAVARFAMPTASMSWFTSGRSPVFEAKVFAINVFSSEARNASANAMLNSAEMSEKISDRIRCGILSIKSLNPNVAKVAVPAKGPVWERINEPKTTEEINKASAKAGHCGRHFLKAKNTSSVVPPINTETQWV